MKHDPEYQETERRQFVGKQIEARGVRDHLVLDAMRKVPRELFVPKDLRAEAYEDSPLPIGSGQTISQPYIVAFMIEALALQGERRSWRSAPDPDTRRPFFQR